jgi:hypothetical protein
MRYQVKPENQTHQQLDLILERNGSKSVQCCLFQIINPQQIILALGKAQRPRNVENGVRLYKDLRKELKSVHKQDDI